MIFGRRRDAAAGPAAVWPGVPLGAQRVFVPVDDQGQLWGTREHGRLFVQARRAHEPHEGTRGVRYEEMSVAEMCQRLPPGAEAGLGIMGRPIDCAHPGVLDRVPAQIDLLAADRGSRVRLADGRSWGVDLSEAAALGDARLYEVVDPGSMTSGALVVVDRADDEVVAGFERLCEQTRVATPVQLWETGNLPGWFHKAARG